jgi:hypothetical protein
MNGSTLNPRVTYWTVFAALVATMVAIGMWKRMSDADKQKMLLGFR